MTILSRFGLHCRPNTRPRLRPLALPCDTKGTKTCWLPRCVPRLPPVPRATGAKSRKTGNNLHLFFGPWGLAPALRWPPSSTLSINSHLIIATILLFRGFRVSTFPTLVRGFPNLSDLTDTHVRRKHASTPIAHPPSATPCRPRSLQPRSAG